MSNVGPSEKTLSAALTALKKAKTLRISDAESSEEAREILKDLKAAENKLEKERKKQKQPFLDGGREVDDEFKPTTKSVTNALSALKAKMASHLRAVQAAQLQKQKAIAEQAAEAQPLKKAAGAEGMDLGQFLTPKLRPDDVPDAPAEAPDYSTRTTTRLVIYDAAQIPREYLAPKEAQILAALKDGKLVPGCKIERDETVVAR